MAGSNRRITLEFLGRDVSAGSTAQKVEQKFGRLGGKLDRVGQAAGKLLVGGAIAGGAALFKMGQAAAEDEQAQAKLATAMRSAAGASDSQIASVETWIEAMGKAVGVADDELRPTLGRLVDATGDVGKAQELAALAMDVSAGTGKDLNAVTEALVKAENGQIGGLSRLGVKVKDAEGKTKSLKEVTGDLASLYGGRAAEAADTAQGKQKILTTQLGELGEKIGASALPYMEKLTEAGLEMADWVSNNTTTVGVLIGVAGSLAAVLYTVSLGMRIVAASTAIATAAKALHNSAILKNIASTVAYYAILAGTGVVVLAQVVAGTIAQTTAILAQAAASKLVSAATKTWAAVNWVLNASIWANPITWVIVGIIAFVAAIVIAYKKSETFRKIVQGAFKGIVAAGKWLWNMLKVAFNGIKSGLSSVGAFAVSVKNKVVAGFNTMVGFIRGVPGKIRALGSKFFDAGKAIIGKIIDGLKAVGGAAGSIASGVYNALKDKINSLITGLNNAIPNKLGTGKLSIDLPDNPIPTLAKGGITTGPTLALIGDNPGGREAVIPLSGPNARSIGGTTVVINIGVATDPRGTAREIRRLLLAEKRLSGTALGLA